MPIIRSEAGLTLTELTIIGILATIVMLALTGFYFGSQQLWMTGSTQAMAQRDASLLLDDLRHRVNIADDAIIRPATPDTAHDELTLSYVLHPDTTVTFRYDPSDSRMHVYLNGVVDQGPVIASPVRRFHVSSDTTLIHLSVLDVRSANGDSITITSDFALMGMSR